MKAARKIRKFLPQAISAALCAIMLFSCRTLPHSAKASRSLTGTPVFSKDALVSYFMSNNPSASRAEVSRLASLYIKEGAMEGINSDIAFAQMCLETGFLRFGNLVTPDMHNYCGLGAIDAQHPGERFETESLGVRAHIQHLHAYGTASGTALKNPTVDPRYRYVLPRGKAPTIFELAGTWAADRQYGEKLDAILTKMQSFR